MFSLFGCAWVVQGAASDFKEASRELTGTLQEPRLGPTISLEEGRDLM